MDLNYLYFRRQVSMMRADRAACEASRNAHLGLATLYDERITGRNVQRPFMAEAAR